jgi:hypothetical protein
MITEEGLARTLRELAVPEEVIPKVLMLMQHEYQHGLAEAKSEMFLSLVMLDPAAKDDRVIFLLKQILEEKRRVATPVLTEQAVVEDSAISSLIENINKEE